MNQQLAEHGAGNTWVDGRYEGAESPRKPLRPGVVVFLIFAAIGLLTALYGAWWALAFVWGWL